MKRIYMQKYLQDCINYTNFAPDKGYLYNYESKEQQN